MKHLRFLGLVSLVMAGNLFAVERCELQDFSGTYALLATGEVTIPGFPITGPFARAGVVVADGRGNVEFRTASSYNGFIFYPSVFSGTYDVTPDCGITFSSIVPAPIDQPATIVGQIANNKKEVRFMIVDPPGQTVRATLTRQSKQRCTQRDLSGDYALDFSGRFQQPLSPPGVPPEELPPPVAPEGFARGGKLHADGRGNFTAWTIANYNGFLIQEEELSGTYTVAGDCSVVLEYVDPATGDPMWWRGGMADNSSIVNLIDSGGCESVVGPEDPSNWCNSGKIVAGQLIRQ